MENIENINTFLKNTISEYLKDFNVYRGCNVSNVYNIKIPKYPFNEDFFKNIIKQIFENILFSVIDDGIKNYKGDVVSINERKIKINNLLGINKTRLDMFSDEFFNIYDINDKDVCYVFRDMLIHHMLNIKFSNLRDIKYNFNSLGRINNIEIYRFSNEILKNYCVILNKDFINFYIDDLVTSLVDIGDYYIINIKFGYIPNLNIKKVIKYC